ncbi:MAG: FKBP-type peptidyl-prolyl cis-trans isomerase [Planctomycetes bacterium]|nr:FKBP-type peptidyl-prolyl cis-trans isomerase [Planctomycetota bacterium]
MRRPITALLAALSLSASVVAEDTKPAPVPDAAKPAAPTQPAPAEGVKSIELPKTGDAALTPTPATTPDTGERTLKKDASYQVGLQMADAIKRFEFDPNEVMRGIIDAVDGKAAIDPAKFQATMEQYQKEMSAGQANKNKSLMADNAKNPKITTTKSGLQYESLTPGAGKTPGPTDTVSVNYRGMLVDGTVFDESAKHGGPATFPVNGVIKGWTEALMLMKEGDKWRLFVPSDLAYGENPPPGAGIPPNSMLIFEVELLKVLPPGSQPKPPGR